MEQEKQKMLFEDGSEDKKYFTILPNYIANHSKANDQALYFQLKRLAGEEKDCCFPSFSYLRKQLKIGKKAIKKSLEYLIERGWIKDLGKRSIMTAGGRQMVQAYKIIDIWALNIEYYKGGSESTPLPKGGPEEPKGGSKEPKGGPVVGAKEEHKELNKNNSKELVKTASYGNGDINYLMEKFREYTGLSKIDGSIKQHRRYCWLLLKKFGTKERVELLLKMGVGNDFHRVNLTSFKYLYYNAIKIGMDTKEKVENPSYVKIK